MPKRILIFSLAYFPKHVGGAEVAIKEITDRIPSSLYEFHMVTLRFDSTLPKMEKVGNVFVHRIGFVKRNPTMADLRKFPLHFNKLLFQFWAFFKAATLHRKLDFYATWAMMAHSCGVPAALFKLSHKKVKYVLTLQEGDPPEYIERKMLPLFPLFKRAFTSADMIQSISTFLVTWSKKMGANCPTVVIPNAVNIKHFSQTYPTEELNGIKDKLKKKKNDVFLITTSRLVKKNACDDVIRSLTHLPKNYHFIILGTGPDEDMLRALARGLKVESRVQFLGQIGHADLPKYLVASDIFIRPSLSEGMGNSFVEAMAAKLPVIATQEGGIADFLFDPELNTEKDPTGRAVKARDPEGIARAAKLYISDKAMTEKIVSNAEKMAREKYDWNLIAKDMEEKVFGALLKV